MDRNENLEKTAGQRRGSRRRDPTPAAEEASDRSSRDAIYRITSLALYTGRLEWVSDGTAER